MKKFLNTMESDHSIYANSSDNSDSESFEKLFEEIGFKVEEIPFYSKEFPVKFAEAFPGEAKDIVYNVLENAKAWKLTPAENIPFEPVEDMDQIELKVETSTDSDVLTMTLSDSIDTLNAPEFLKAYDEAKEKAGHLKEVVIDAKDLSSTTSTGLRVLRILAEDMGPDKVRIINVQTSVKELLESEEMDDIIDIQCH